MAAPSTSSPCDLSQPLLQVPEVDTDVPSYNEPDDAETRLARKVVRKVDCRILPLLFMTYMLNFMDKVILSSAAVFGLRRDTHLRGQQYSWISSAFYIGYFLWTYPASALTAKLPTAKYLSANTLFWGAAVLSTAACRNFADLMMARLLLGAAEASITPAFLVITSTWYTREEMPVRVGCWFAGNSVGGIASSLLAYGFGKFHSSLHPWRWMYAFLGTATFLWALPTYYLLPNSIASAKFLSREERHVAIHRMSAQPRVHETAAVWKWSQFKECLLDPQPWMICFIELLVQVPNSSTQSFSNIVIKSFGFTSLQSTLINIPYSLLATGIIIGTGYMASKSRQLNCFLIATVAAPCILGATIIYHRDRVWPGTRIFAYFLLSFGPASMPLNMALLQTNLCGATKKATGTAMLFGAYCIGNIIGPQLFREKEAPTHSTAIRAIIISYSLSVILVLILRYYLVRLNSSRASKKTVAQLRNRWVEDLTDRQIVEFKYRL